VFSIILATVGFWYNFSSLSASFSSLVKEQDIPYFYPAFYTMSVICIACYVVLLLCGIQFVRLRAGVFPVFVGILIFEVIYFFSIGFLWVIPYIGKSIAAATGVANGGLMFQAFVLFPLWAPFLAGWAAKRISKSEEPQNLAVHPMS
jgi:hypothetical protein